MSSPHGAAAASVSAAAIRAALSLGSQRPAAGIILGSGLGGLADRITSARRIAFGEVPGFPTATIVGHAGAVIAGQLGGKLVLAMAGRFHMYEGHDASLAALPVRVMHALGVDTLIVSNAAGGLRRTFQPGDLMVIEDHINLMFRNPLIGAVEPGEERFPDMSSPYDKDLQTLLRQVAARRNIRLVEGVYAGLLGPAYETPAEVRMLDRIGADAVGMSTVPEVIAARALGMRVLGVSCITNMACGISTTRLDHAEVLETTTRVAHDFETMIEDVIAAM